MLGSKIRRNVLVLLISCTERRTGLLTGSKVCCDLFPLDTREYYTGQRTMVEWPWPAINSPLRSVFSRCLLNAKACVYLTSVTNNNNNHSRSISAFSELSSNCSNLISQPIRVQRRILNSSTIPVYSFPSSRLRFPKARCTINYHIVWTSAP